MHCSPQSSVYLWHAVVLGAGEAVGDFVAVTSHTQRTIKSATGLMISCVDHTRTPDTTASNSCDDCRI